MCGCGGLRKSLALFREIGLFPGRGDNTFSSLLFIIVKPENGKTLHKELGVKGSSVTIKIVDKRKTMFMTRQFFIGHSPNNQRKKSWRLRNLQKISKN